MKSVEQKPEVVGLGIVLGEQHELEATQTDAVETIEQTAITAGEEEFEVEDIQPGSHSPEESHESRRSISAFSDSSDEEEAPGPGDHDEETIEDADDTRSDSSSEFDDINVEELPRGRSRSRSTSRMFEDFDGNHANPENNNDSESDYDRSVPTTPPSNSPQASPDQPQFSPRTKERIAAEESRGYLYHSRPKNIPTLNRIMWQHGRDWDPESAARFRPGTFGRGRSSHDVQEERNLNRAVTDNVPRMPSRLNPKRKVVNELIANMDAQDRIRQQMEELELAGQMEAPVLDSPVSPLSVENEQLPAQSSVQEEHEAEVSPVSSPVRLADRRDTSETTTTDAETAATAPAQPAAHRLSWEAATNLKSAKGWADDDDDEDFLESLRRASEGNTNAGSSIESNDAPKIVLESGSQEMPQVLRQRLPPGLSLFDSMWADPVNDTNNGATGDMGGETQSSPLPSRPDNGMATAMLAASSPDPQSQTFSGDKSQTETPETDLVQEETTQDQEPPVQEATPEEPASPGAEDASTTNGAPTSTEAPSPHTMSSTTTLTTADAPLHDLIDQKDYIAVAEKFRSENKDLKSKVASLNAELRGQYDGYRDLYDHYVDARDELKHSKAVVESLEKMLDSKCDDCVRTQQTSGDIEDALTDGAPKDESCEGRCKALEEKLAEERARVVKLEKAKNELEAKLQDQIGETDMWKGFAEKNDEAAERERQREEAAKSTQSSKSPVRSVLRYYHPVRWELELNATQREQLVEVVATYIHEKTHTEASIFELTKIISNLLSNNDLDFCEFASGIAQHGLQFRMDRLAGRIQETYQAMGCDVPPAIRLAALKYDVDPELAVRSLITDIEFLERQALDSKAKDEANEAEIQQKVKNFTDSFAASQAQAQTQEIASLKKALEECRKHGEQLRAEHEKLQGAHQEVLEEIQNRLESSSEGSAHSGEANDSADECKRLADENALLKKQIADLELRISSLQAIKGENAKELQAYKDEGEARDQIWQSEAKEKDSRIRQLEADLEQARHTAPTATPSLPNDSWSTARSHQSSPRPAFAPPMPGTPLLGTTGTPQKTQSTGGVYRRTNRPAGWQARDRRWLNSPTAERMREQMQSQRREQEARQEEEAELRRQVYEKLVKKPKNFQMSANERRAKLMNLSLV